MTPLRTRERAMLEELKCLRARVVEQKDLIRRITAPPPSCVSSRIPLTATQLALLGALHRTPGYLTIDAAMAVVEGVNRRPTTLNSLRVQIHRMRERLAPYRIQIVSHFGIGYALTPASRSRFAASSADEPPAAHS